MNVPNTAVKGILKNIPDAKQRNLIDKIISGKVAKEIICLSEDKKDAKGKVISKGCNGRTIGYIYDNGRVEVKYHNKLGYLRATRHRLDGYMGFQCWCGNDSRLSEQEKSVTGIANNSVTKKDLEEVYENLQRKPAHYTKTDGIQIVDNFEIRETK